MKCEIVKGVLVATAESNTEAYALAKWIEDGKIIEWREMDGKAYRISDSQPKAKEVVGATSFKDDFETTVEPETTQPATTVAMPEEREAIKAKLRALGVEFKEQARLPTLKQLLAYAMSKPVDSSEEGEAEESAVEPEAIDINSIRSSLIAYSKKYGTDRARALLTKYKAENVSKLKPDYYPQLSAEIERELNG